MGRAELGRTGVSQRFAGNGIMVHSNLTTTTGNLSLDGDHNNVADSGTSVDNISFDTGVILTSAADITLQAKTGGMIRF